MRFPSKVTSFNDSIIAKFPIVFKELDKKKEFDYKEDNQILRALDLIKGLLILSK